MYPTYSTVALDLNSHNFDQLILYSAVAITSYSTVGSGTIPYNAFEDYQNRAR